MSNMADSNFLLFLLNAFENWSQSPSLDDVTALTQRATEIKNLVENTVVTAKENIKKAQIKQKLS